MNPADRMPVEAFRARAAARLRTGPPGVGDLIARPRGDHEHQEHPVPVFDEAKARPAAVLVPVVARPEGATVLLTQRAAGLAKHAAQISFPGGRIDESDESELAAALREAQEEIGLSAAHVRPLGYLDAYLTGTGYRIVPVVAEVEPGFILSVNASEVDEVFETPLGFLMNPANHHRHAREWQGVMRSYYAMPHGDRYIWGATAGILKNLYDRLFASEA